MWKDYVKAGILLTIYIGMISSMIWTLGFGFYGAPTSHAKVTVNNEVCKDYRKTPNIYEKCLNAIDGAVSVAQEKCANYVSLLESCRSVNPSSCAQDRVNVDACYIQIVAAEIKRVVPAMGIA